MNQRSLRATILEMQVECATDVDVIGLERVHDLHVKTFLCATTRNPFNVIEVVVKHADCEMHDVNECCFQTHSGSGFDELSERLAMFHQLLFNYSDYPLPVQT